MSSDAQPRCFLSVVIPAFNEGEGITALVDSLMGTLTSMGEPFEVILVDDGSRDDTWKQIRMAHDANPCVKGISLSRNFGHQAALSAGLAHATGRVIVSMDADLQHPPETIKDLVAAWRRGFKVVQTVRLDGQETSAFKRLTSRWFYGIFSRLSDIDMPRGSSDFRLLDGQVLEAVMKVGDPDLFLRGIIQWVGFPATTISYRARPRFAGRTKYSLRRMVRFSAAALVSFSTIPLKLGIWVGLVTSALAFLEIAYIVVRYFQGVTVPGWASLGGVVSFMFGVLFILLGILGTYVGSIHDAVKSRPRFLVNEAVGIERGRSIAEDGRR